MKAGALRHRIAIQSFAAVIDGEATAETWADVASGVPAQRRPLNGREIAAAGTVKAGTSAAFVIRAGNAPGITAAMRIVHEGETFNITQIVRDETLRDHVTIIAEAGVRG